MPQDIVNAKPVVASVKEFFGLSRLVNLWIKQIH